MLVEDIENNRMIVRKMLSKAGLVAETAKDAGMNDLVKKPVDLDRLLAALDQLQYD